MNKRTKRNQAKTRLAKASPSPRHKVPLVEHLHELKRRVFYVAAAVVGVSIVAYGLQQNIISVLLRPSHGQKFIYTSPLGGINFLFSVCLYVGVGVSIPLIVYQLLRFLQPLMRATTVRFIFTGSLISGLLAAGGIAFGYFIGLPAALHFLLNQFVTKQIQPLVTIQSYLAFVMAYLLGSALMFQLPLLLLFINRITPLKPRKLFSYERHVVVVAFIIGFIMNPSPNLIHQLFVVVPIILMYQVGIGLIWIVNRGGKQTRVQELLEADRALQAERWAKASQLQPLPRDTTEPASETATAPPPIATTQPLRRRYVDGFAVRRTNYGLRPAEQLDA